MSARDPRQDPPVQGDLRELYQEVIFDHNRKPRNFRALEPADHVAHGHNPLCGDQLTVYLRVADGVIDDVSFEASRPRFRQAAGAGRRTRFSRTREMRHARLAHAAQRADWCRRHGKDRVRTWAWAIDTAKPGKSN